MLFVKKIMRDLFKKHKSRSFPIIILILVSQLASILYIEVGILMNSSWDQYFDESNVGDVWIDTIPISSSTFNSSMINTWRQSFPSIEAIQPRLYFKGYMIINNEKIPVDILSFPDNKAKVNSIITQDGSYFSDFSEIENGVYLEQSYREHYNLEELIEINLNVQNISGVSELNMTVLGGAFSPEYPMAPGEGSTQFAQSASFAPYLTMSVFVRTDFLQKILFQEQIIYNSICVSFEEKAGIDDFIRYLQTDESPLNQYIIDVREYPRLIEDMVSIMVAVGWGVALFFLILSMFLTYTIVSRFIEEMRPQIGVLKSLGYSNRYLLSRNLLYGLILGSIGSILGNVIGILISIILADLLLNSWLSLPFLIIDVPVVQIFLMITITIIFSLLACYISARRIVRISPQSAFKPTIAERRVNTFFVERFIQRVFRRRLSVSSKYSIRNIFTNPKRTLTTIISLFMAIALVGGIFTIIVMVFSGSSLIFESEKWDAQVSLSSPQNFSDVETEFLSKLSAHDSLRLEPILLDFSKIKINEIWIKVTFTALSPDPELKDLGSVFLSNNSCLVSSDIAQQYELEAEGSYSLLSRDGTEYPIQIGAILPVHYVSSFYIPLSLGNLLIFGNDSTQMVNGVLLESSEDLSTSEVGVITSITYVNSVILKRDLIETTEKWYQQMTSIFIVLFFLVLVIAAIIIYAIMSISIAERKDDLIIMKAVGIQNRNIYLWTLLEILTYTLVASIGYFFGFYISLWYMEILQQLMQQPQSSADLSLLNYLISLLFGFVAATLGQFMALRIVLKQRIAEVTKEKMFG
ncbi:MAG: FtsX-like permease family protein [Candidatus Hodarchaeales archaeon]